MEIAAALAAELAVLSQALDQPDADIADTLREFAADAKLAVRSYLGLTVSADDATSLVRLTALDELADPNEVLSSLTIPLSQLGADGRGPRLTLVLYAARPGAFVDLAADLSWLTGLGHADFVLDQHLRLLAAPALDRQVQTASVVNQAIGVLMGRGYTPEQAGLELDAQAAGAGQNRYDAATIILSSLSGIDLDSTARP